MEELQMENKEKKPMGKWTKRLLKGTLGLWGVFIALMIFVSMADEPEKEKAEAKASEKLNKKLM